MKIALLTSALHQGSGVSRVAIQVGNGLVERGHEVKMITTLLHPIETRFEVFKLGSLFSIDKIRDVDVIYCHYGKLEPVSAYLKLRLKRPLVIHDHGTAFPWLFSGGAKFKSTLEFIMRVPSMYLADRIITISRFLQRINWIIYRRNSVVIYNGIDDRFNFSPQKRYTIRSRLNLENRILILFVGRWSSHKRIERLISNIVNLRKNSQSNLVLGLIGYPTSEKGYRRQILQAIQDAGEAVVNLGPVDEGHLNAFYSAADIYATSSGWEGFNLPIFEAGKTGIPSVAFLVGSHKEFKSDSFFLVQNDMQFRETILHLAKGIQKKKLQKIKRRGFATRFTWNRAVNQIETILEEVVAKRLRS
jgi:glycosyltransferase involved in cell wall biosynthesis